MATFDQKRDFCKKLYMHATQRQENIWQYEGQIWNQLEKLQLEVSVWPYFYSFMEYHIAYLGT